MIQDSLSPKEFEVSPVWAWTDDEESYESISNYSPLPDDFGSLFIAADLTFADGTKIKGCVAGHTSFHALGIFYDDVMFTINLRSREAMDRGLKRLSIGLGREIENFFPIKFETNLFYKTGEKVAGELQPKFWK